MQKKLTRFLLFVLLPILAFIGLDSLFHPTGKQFHASRLETSFPNSSEWELPTLSASEQKKVDQILDQNFTFFNKGTQAAVFLSEDKKYVIKFLKQRKFRPTSWLCFVPVSFNPYYKDFLVRKQRRINTFNACKIGVYELKEETGVLYAHLNRSHNLNKKLTVFYKDGDMHLIDLDKTNFMIQKRASLIYSRITELMANGDIPGAQNVLSLIFSLLETLGKKGIVDNDPVIHKNFGIIKDKAVQIDIGTMKLDPLSAKNGTYKTLIPGTTQILKTWIEKNYPELQPHFEECLRASCS